MNLSEKITELRKRAGLSQEELGAQIKVSRQAVSKWEMAQTTPDLNKIMAMSELFQVSTDFLLKSEYDLSDLENLNENKESDSGKMIDLESIQEYLEQIKKAAQNYVVAIFLFFISPLTGIVLSVYHEEYAVIGIIVQILILILIAVILVLTIWNMSKYRYLKENDAELAYGVRPHVQERKEQFNHRFLMGILVGIVCMIASVIPMVIVSMYTDTNDAYIIFSAFLMLMIFSFGMSNIVYVCTINHGYKRVLQMR